MLIDYGLRGNQNVLEFLDLFHRLTLHIGQLVAFVSNGRGLRDTFREHAVSAPFVVVYLLLDGHYALGGWQKARRFSFLKVYRLGGIHCLGLVHRRAEERDTLEHPGRGDGAHWGQRGCETL